jgi:hypothetical protein
LDLEELAILLLVIAFAVAGGFAVYRFRRKPHKVLTLLVTANIVFDVLAVAIWLFPWAQWSVYRISYVAAIAEAGVAAAVFAVALYGLKVQMAWAPKLAIVLTVVQRVFATYIFFPSPALAFTLIWSLLIIAFAVLAIKNTRRSLSAIS